MPKCTGATLMHSLLYSIGHAGSVHLSLYYDRLTLEYYNQPVSCKHEMLQYQVRGSV